MICSRIDAGSEAEAAAAAEQPVRLSPSLDGLAAEARWRYLLPFKLDMRTFAAIDLALEQGTITFGDVPGYIERGRGGQLGAHHWLVEDGKLADNEKTWSEISDRSFRVIHRWFDEAEELIR